MNGHKGQTDLTSLTQDPAFRCRLGFNVPMRTPMAATIVAVCLAACGASAADHRAVTGPARPHLLTLSDLPTDWKRMPDSGNQPPCLQQARPALPRRGAMFVGESNDLATLSEMIYVTPAGQADSVFSQVARGYSSCEGSSWTSGATHFQLSLVRRAAPTLGNRSASFTTSITSPSTNVAPNPYPGYVDIVENGSVVLVIAMEFASIPPDATTFDKLAALATTRTAQE